MGAVFVLLLVCVAAGAAPLAPFGSSSLAMRHIPLLALGGSDLIAAKNWFKWIVTFLKGWYRGAIDAMKTAWCEVTCIALDLLKVLIEYLVSKLPPSVQQATIDGSAAVIQGVNYWFPLAEFAVILASLWTFSGVAWIVFMVLKVVRGA